MKRFYRAVAVAAADGGWRVLLDGRPIRTPAGAPQIVPTRALADALAAEWEGQGDTIDPARLVLRDLADFAIDAVVPRRPEVIAEMLPFAETDTLCYRDDPDGPLYQQQRARWEPVLVAAEARLGVRLDRVCSVIARPLPPETRDRLTTLLDAQDGFVLAALSVLASLAASLVIALEAIERNEHADALWALAELEERWQAERWGRDAEAETRRERRRRAFGAAARFAALSARHDPDDQVTAEPTRSGDPSI